MLETVTNHPGGPNHLSNIQRNDALVQPLVRMGLPIAAEIRIWVHTAGLGTRRLLHSEPPAQCTWTCAHKVMRGTKKESIRQVFFWDTECWHEGKASTSNC